MSDQNNEQQQILSSSRNYMSKLKLVDLLLRICVIPLTLASFWITLTNHQDNPDYGSIKFINFTSLKYMHGVDVVAAGYAFVAVISHWVRFFINKVWFFFVSDQVMAYLMVTSGSAGAELLYLAYNGDVQVSWSEACNPYGKFCTKLKFALILHFLALLCFFVLAIISAFRAFSLFDPPLISDRQANDDRRRSRGRN